MTSPAGEVAPFPDVRVWSGNVEAPFGVDTLREYGEFFECPSMLVNRSIGEPFMMKDLDAILDELGDRGKVLELTSTGQILTDRNIQKLLGRNVTPLCLPRRRHRYHLRPPLRASPRRPLRSGGLGRNDARPAA